MSTTPYDTINHDVMSGTINYVITQIVNRCMIRNEPKYDKINSVVGVLECVKLEMYRRLASKYEDQAIKNNGDIKIYELL